MNLPDFIEPFFLKESELYQVSEYVLGVAKNVRAQKLDARQKSRKIVMISGLSGAGKDSIVDSLAATSRFIKIKTLTTRPRRPEEVDEEDPYERVTVGQFEDYLRRGEIIESTEYAGNLYGSRKGNLEEALLTGRTPMLRVDPKGADYYLQRWDNGDPLFEKVTLIYIFVIPPTMETLRTRLLTRSHDPNFVEKRMEKSYDDITHIGDAEYIVINESGKLKEVVGDIMALL